MSADFGHGPVAMSQGMIPKNCHKILHLDEYMPQARSGTLQGSASAKAVNRCFESSFSSTTVSVAQCSVTQEKKTHADAKPHLFLETKTKAISATLRSASRTARGHMMRLN